MAKRLPNGDRIAEAVMQAAKEAGLILKVSVGGAGSRSFRHWRFFRSVKEYAFMNYWPTTGRWNTPDGERGMAGDGWQALEEAKRLAKVVVIPTAPPHGSK